MPRSQCVSPKARVPPPLDQERGALAARLFPEGQRIAECWARRSPGADPDELAGAAALAIVTLAATCPIDGPKDDREWLTLARVAARRAMANVLEAQRRRRRGQVDVDLSRAVGPGPPPSERIEGEARSLWLQDALATLAPRDREALERHAKGEALNAIGRDWGVSGQRVGQVHKKALDALKARAADGDE